MSDDSPVPSAAPAPAAPTRLFETPQVGTNAAPAGIVRGTAVMTGWMEKALNEAEEDRQIRLAESDAHQAEIKRAKTNEDVNEYGMEHTADMGRPGQSAVVILEIPYSQSRVQFCQADLTETEGTHGTSITLNMICPDCHQRGIPQAWCQIKIDDRNKKMSIDYKTKGKVWVDPDTHQPHLVAGNIDVSEAFRCDRPGCGFKAKISGTGPNSENGVSRVIRE